MTKISEKSEEILSAVRSVTEFRVGPRFFLAFAKDQNLTTAEAQAPAALVEFRKKLVPRAVIQLAVAEQFGNQAKQDGGKHFSREFPFRRRNRSRRGDIQFQYRHSDWNRDAETTSPGNSFSKLDRNLGSGYLNEPATLRKPIEQFGIQRELKIQ